MWVLPKNYEPSRYAMATVASKEELSQQALRLNTSLFVKSKPMPLPTRSEEWKKGSWIRALFGRILRPSQWDAFHQDLLTSSQEAIRVSPSVRPVKALAKMIPDTCGPTSKTLSSLFDQLDASSRTFEDTLPTGCIASCPDWETWVTELQQDYSQRMKLAHHTRDKESLYWPTAWTSDAVGRRVETKMTTSGFRSRRAKSNQWFGAKLRDAVESVKNWPTPNARDYKDSPNQATTRKDGRNKEDQLPRVIFGQRSTAVNSTHGKSHARLNPAWVEQLMGLPIGLTNLGSWGTE